MRLPRQRTGDSRTPSSSVHGEHAVVLGASMSGLLAARVLSDYFDQVTVVERDRLPEEGRPRRGVPQARHAHLLLARGGQIIDELFPDFQRELVEAGVPYAEGLDQFHLEVNGHVFFHDPDDERSRRPEVEGVLLQPSRPFLDAALLRRIRQLPNVDFLDGCDVERVTTNSTMTRVSGVWIASRDAASVRRSLPADLVVCATGRSSRATAWLKAMGYAPPQEEELVVGLKYATRRVRFPSGSLDHLRGMLVGPTPERPVGAFAFAQERDTWIVTLQGYNGHHPPLGPDEWLAFADRVMPPHIAEPLHEAEPLEDPHQHRFSANLRRHYEKLTRFPDGFLVTGDALASFNPVYGQGMTVAAMEALALRDSLEHGSDHLAHRFFKAVTKPINNAWQFAAGGDLALPEKIVPGARPLPVRLINGYVERVSAAAEHDPVMAWRFFDVTGFDAPTATLFSPDSLRRLAQDRRHHRRTAVPTKAMAAAKGWTWP